MGIWIINVRFKKMNKQNKLGDFPRAKREAVAFVLGLIQSPSPPAPAPWEKMYG